jgi:hypothetical protein
VDDENEGEAKENKDEEIQTENTQFRDKDMIKTCKVTVK